MKDLFESLKNRMNNKRLSEKIYRHKMDIYFRQDLFYINKEHSYSFTLTEEQTMLLSTMD